MNSGKIYNTKQRTLILSCLKENRGRLVTAEMIADHLEKEGNPVGQTTIYRHLDKLVKNGRVLKLSAPNGSYSCYRYLAPSEERGYHLVCVDCGRTSLLDCGHMDNFDAHIRLEHGFDLDHGKAILYGHCKGCKV
jgi:Fur family ferric uptake transcriptional regulator